MEKLCVLSFSHESCDIASLEQVHATGRAEEFLYKLSPFLETVYLQTCNRREVLALNTDREKLEKFSGSFFGISKVFIKNNSAYFEGKEALMHLAQTAAGLKSAVVGENEVLGQVKSALANARTAFACGTGMEKAFNIILRAAKKAKSQTSISDGPASAIGAAIEMAGKYLELKESIVLLVGTGKTIEIAAKKLLKKGAAVSFISGRNPEKAAALAQKTGAGVFSLDKISEPLKYADLVISATAAPHFVIGKNNCSGALKGRKNNLYIFDLAVPRDVDPSLGSNMVKIFDMDDIKEVSDRNLKLRLGEKAKALAIIEEVVENADIQDRDKKKRAGLETGSRGREGAFKEGSFV
jgi:glutamyl-tRNA reductase